MSGIGGLGVQGSGFQVLACGAFAEGEAVAFADVLLRVQILVCRGLCFLWEFGLAARPHVPVLTRSVASTYTGSTLYDSESENSPVPYDRPKSQNPNCKPENPFIFNILLR